MTEQRPEAGPANQVPSDKPAVGAAGLLEHEGVVSYLHLALVVAASMAVVVTVVFVLSHVMVRDSTQLCWSDATPYAVQELDAKCSLRGHQGGLLRVTCGEVEWFAYPAAVVPITSDGVTERDAQAAFETAISEFVALSTKTPGTCRRISFAPGAPSAGMVYADCNLGPLSLAQYLLFSGRAALASPPIVQAVFASAKRQEVIQAAAQVALDESSGLWGAVLGKRADRRIQVQTWLAAVLGVTGGIAFFFFRDNKRRGSWQLQLSRLVQRADKQYSEYRQRLTNPHELLATIEQIRWSLETLPRTQRSGPLAVANRVSGSITEFDKFRAEGRNPTLLGVQTYYEELSKELKKLCAERMP